MAGNKGLDIALCWLPYGDLGTPSLALSLLKAEAAREGLRARVVYSNHRLVERLGYQNYRRMERALRMFVMGWEILFAPYAGFTPRLAMRDMLAAMRTELREYSQMRGQPDESEAVVADLEREWAALDREIPAFLESEVAHILSLRPKIVGVSVMTQQRNAAFALLKRLKERAPEIRTVLGGGICVGETGREFLRLAPQIDYVFTGEGDAAFGAGCRLLIEGREDELRARYPAFLKRGGETHVRVTDDLDAVAIPDYDDYFEQIEGEDFGDALKPCLLVEGSRGCWWAEKGRCRFCGLHFCREAMAYRQKRPERVWEEIRAQMRRYDCSHMMLTDCILSPDFIRALPDTRGERPRARLFAECKSNITEDDIVRLKRAGFTNLQPGIESLHDGPLTLMHKGNRAIKHVALLKFARLHGVKVAWNILMALPGERACWYDEMIDLMNRLHHLQPPVNVWPMILMRCSVYQEEAASFGLHTVLPQYFYQAMDPDDEEFTRQTAVFLRSPQLPVDPDMVTRMNEATSAWRRDYEAGARLTARATAEGLAIVDGRTAGEEKRLLLTGARRAVCERARDVIGEAALCAALNDTYGAPEVAEALEYLAGMGLLVRIGGEAVCLALDETEKA